MAPRLGAEIIRVVRTIPLEGGTRSIWYLPGGRSVHAIENRPLPPGVYFLTPDETGKFRNWVIECEIGTRTAVVGRGSVAAPRRHVEVHKGNSMKDTVGCTCPGTETTFTGVANSRKALSLMRELLLRDDKNPPTWVLHITGE